MKIIIATNNQHKVAEIRSALPHIVEVISLKEAGITIDIPEPHHTLEENAQEKATVIYKLTGQNCFSEDTGLEVEALNGAPGVHSARYAGEEASAEKNIDKLLQVLKDSENRKAQFRTVICLILNAVPYFFEGICTGRIITEPAGSGGFGYDALFIADGAAKTFAQMTVSEKNEFSHRRKAVDKLVAFLSGIAINS